MHTSVAVRELARGVEGQGRVRSRVVEYSCAYLARSEHRRGIHALITSRVVVVLGNAHIRVFRSSCGGREKGRNDCMVGCGRGRRHVLAVVLLLRLRRFVLLLLFEIATASMVSRIYAFTSWSLVVGCGGLVQRRGL